MKANMQILWALNDLGDDVLEQAEQLRFGPPVWQRLLPVVACLAMLLGAGHLLRQLEPISQEPPAEIVEEAPEQAGEPEAPVQPTELAWIWEPEVPTCYALPWENGYVAVTPEGTEILRVDAGTLRVLTDRATGEALALLHTVHPTAPDTEPAITTIYDLDGNQLKQVEAWDIQVFGDVAVIQCTLSDFMLYDRRYKRVVQTNLKVAWILGDTIMGRPREAEYDTGFWSKGGGLIETVGQGLETCFFVEWNGRAYYEAYNSYWKEDGTWDTRNHGVVDGQGNWVMEPYFTDVDLLPNGYASGFGGAFYTLVDLDTGEVVAQIPMEAGKVVGAYQDLLLVSLDDNPRTANQVLSWDGTPITAEVDRIIVIDDEGDGIPELLQLWNGTVTTWLLPDGETLLRSVSGEAQTVTSRTAVVLGETVSLLDLQTGSQIPLPDRDYTTAVARWPGGDEDYATGLFFASYTDENGQTHTDILREDGMLLLENYAQEPNKWARVGEEYGVFQVEGGYRRIDGTWIFREE